MIIDNKYNYWQWLKSRLAEHQQLNADLDQFDDWLGEKYGVRPIYNSGGYITEHFQIVDEKKYTWLVLSK